MITMRMNWRTLIATFLAIASLPATSWAASPFFVASWRLVDSSTDKPADRLMPGGTFELHVTLSLKQANAVKINPLLNSHQVELSGFRGAKRSVKISGGRVDAATGKATLRIVVDKQATQLPAELVLRASAVVCDQGEQWCAAARETAPIRLPFGKQNMSPLDLRYGADKAKRLVLKPGDVAPDFELPNQDEKPTKLSNYKGSKAVILVFSRAHW